MESDRYGLALTTSSAKAAAAYRHGVDLLLSAWPGAEDSLLEAIAHDPGFALAHAALARHLQIYGRMVEARETIARAHALVATATAREAAHVRVLGLAIEGHSAGALAALLEHLEAHPRDALAFSLALGAFGLYGFSGRPDHDAARLALCRRLAPHYGEDWWFLTHLAWSHTEAGELAAGGLITARALELRSENAYGAHAYVHFFAEAGERDEGARFIQAWLPGYDRGGTLHAHISWHRALWRLDEGDAAGAAAIYREVLRPAVNSSPPINVISDCASLLWRFSLRNQVAEWRELADYGRCGRGPPRIGRAAARRAVRGASRAGVPGRVRRVQGVRGRRLRGRGRAPRADDTGIQADGRQRRPAAGALRYARGRTRARPSGLERLELGFFGVVLVGRLHRPAIRSDQPQNDLLFPREAVERAQPRQEARQLRKALRIGAAAGLGHEAHAALDTPGPFGDLGE